MAKGKKRDPDHEVPEPPDGSRVVSSLTINRVVYPDGTMHTHVYAPNTDYLDNVECLGLLQIASFIVMYGGD